jgi:NADH:ubiquinone oxidoreductase subunit 5 (subunit L)/multisubunit Na+/H+ antiporter MnhA subunit
VNFPQGAAVEKTLVLIKPDNFRVPSTRPGGVMDVFSRSGLYIVGFKVQGHAVHSVFKLQKLAVHAFFKAVLFLGAGSVIIAMHHEQDMRKMGGLRKYLPWTYAVVLIGAWANAGIPPFAGFFGKLFFLDS